MNRGGLAGFAGRSGEMKVIVVHLGIGLESAGRTIRAVLAAGKPGLVIGAGFAGGLDPRLHAGDTVRESFSAPRASGTSAILSRGDPVETTDEKESLFRATGARVVDMETEILAAECDACGVPLIVVRAVSDTADEALPVPFGVWFDVVRQRVRPLALIGFLIRSPSKIAPFARFALRLPRVAAALARAIEETLRAFAKR
jgi:adenosylhomocysteine nucleosidase